MAPLSRSSLLFLGLAGLGACGPEAPEIPTSDGSDEQLIARAAVE